MSSALFFCLPDYLLVCLEVGYWSQLETLCIILLPVDLKEIPVDLSIFYPMKKRSSVCSNNLTSL